MINISIEHDEVSTVITVKNKDFINITCTSDGNPIPSVSMQIKKRENHWTELPNRVLRETVVNSTVTVDFNYKVEKETSFVWLRCVAANIVQVAISKELLVANTGMGLLFGTRSMLSFTVYSL